MWVFNDVKGHVYKSGLGYIGHFYLLTSSQLVVEEAYMYNYVNLNWDRTYLILIMQRQHVMDKVAYDIMQFLNNSLSFR